MQRGLAREERRTLSVLTAVDCPNSENPPRHNAGLNPVGNLAFFTKFGPLSPPEREDSLISQKVFRKSFCRSQFLHKFVNLSIIITNIRNELTDLCRN